MTIESGRGTGPAMPENGDSIIPDPGPAPTVDPVTEIVRLTDGNTTTIDADDTVFGRELTTLVGVESQGVALVNNGVLWTEDDPFDPAVSNQIDQRILVGDTVRLGNFSVTNNGLMYTWAQGFANTVLSNSFNPVTVTNAGSIFAISEGIEAAAIQTDGSVTVDNSGIIAAQTQGTFGVLQNEGNAYAILAAGGFGSSSVINNAGGQILAEAPNLAVAIRLRGQSGSPATTPLVDNDGLIEARLSAAGSQEIGIFVDGGSSFDSVIQNSGTIRATNAITGTAQIRLENEVGGVIEGALTLGRRDDTVINDGTITGIVVDLGEDDDTLTNNGTITADIEFGLGQDIVTNTGLIEGDFDFGGGNDTLTNSGEINGDIVATSGNNTIIDNGTIRGGVTFGDGNDQLVSNSQSSFYLSNNSGAQLGGGDDTLRLEGLADGSNPFAYGGAGRDTIELASTSNFVTDNTTGFEVLAVFQGGNLTDFNGYEEINILADFNGGTQADAIEVGPHFIDSNSPDAAVRLESGAISAVLSSFASVTGSAGREAISAFQNSFFGVVDMGGGDDLVWVRQNQALAQSFTSLEGGDGGLDDLWFEIDDDLTDSFAIATGFERILFFDRRPLEDQTEALAITLSNISGATELGVGFAQLTLSAGATGDMSMTGVRGAIGGSVSIASDLTIADYQFTRSFGPPFLNETPDASRSIVFLNDGSVLGDIVFDNGNDTYSGLFGVVGGTVFGHAGDDALFGGSQSDILDGGTGDDELNGGDAGDILIGGLDNDILDGGSNIDTAVFNGNRADYTITQTETGVFEIVGLDGNDTLTAIEFAQFDDQTIRLLRGDGVAVNFETSDPSVYQDAMNSILDFDGNALGGNGNWLRIGAADVNGDGDIDQILVNDAIGRFATVGTAPDGLVYFNDNSWAGETRVAGIYLDPLVQSGDVEQGSPFDSQQRFQNDLAIENINRVLGADDYDGDGLQEVYFALTDGTAYLRAIMEADGNIRYANYQDEQGVIDYLTANGFGEETYGNWFPAPDADGARAAATMPAAAMAPMDLFHAEVFG